MFYRFRQFLLFACALAMVIANVLPTSVQTQYTHQPEIVQLEEEPDCTDIAPLIAANTRPLFLSYAQGKPGSGGCSSNSAYIDAIALSGNGQQVIVPVMSDGKSRFNAGNNSSAVVPYNLSASLTYTDVQGLRGTTPNGILKSIKYAFAITGTTRLLTTQTDVNQPVPESPVNLQEVQASNRMEVLDEFILNNRAGGTHLPRSTPLYAAPVTESVPQSIDQLCPGTFTDPTYPVYLKTAYTQIDNISGSRISVWVLIEHTPVTLQLCPRAASWRWVNGITLWAALSRQVQKEIDTEIDQRTRIWSKKIMLEPNPDFQPAPGQPAPLPVFADAQFMAFDNGEVIVVYIIVIVAITATAIFLGPQMYMLVLAV